MFEFDHNEDRWVSDEQVRAQHARDVRHLSQERHVNETWAYASSASEAHYTRKRQVRAQLEARNRTAPDGLEGLVVELMEADDESDRALDLLMTGGYGVVELAAPEPEEPDFALGALLGYSDTLMSEAGPARRTVNGRDGVRIARELRKGLRGYAFAAEQELFGKSIREIATAYGERPSTVHDRLKVEDWPKLRKIATDVALEEPPARLAKLLALALKKPPTPEVMNMSDTDRILSRLDELERRLLDDQQRHAEWIVDTVVRVVYGSVAGGAEALLAESA